MLPNASAALLYALVTQQTAAWCQSPNPERINASGSFDVSFNTSPLSSDIDNIDLNYSTEQTGELDENQRLESTVKPENMFVGSRDRFLANWIALFLLLNAGAGYAELSPGNRTLCQATEIPGNRVNTTGQLTTLRGLMMAAGVDAYLVTYEDNHNSEPSDHDQRLEFVSGFSGSNGYAWITADRAALWTDGRYFLQADQQMDCQWILMKSGVAGYPEAKDWLVDVLERNSMAAADPALVSISRWQSYETHFAQNFKNLTLVARDDFVNKTWTEDRPERPNNDIYEHILEFAGQPWSEKISNLREKLSEDGVHMYFSLALDETAWLFNLRGSDRSTSPLFYSYARISQDDIVLYLNNVSKLLTPAIAKHLNTSVSGVCDTPDGWCVSVKEYDMAVEDLAGKGAEGQTIWITPSATYEIYESAGERRYLELSPVQLDKSIKNSVEIAKYYECQVRDSAALVEVLHELETMMDHNENLTELQVSDIAMKTRARYDHFKMLSFDTISGYGPNGAVIHYRPSESTNLRIGKDSLLLLDSGGNYLDGTTDVTRTLHYGTPTDEHREAYTRVLQGQIELALTVWPEGLYGSDIDVRARTPIWQNGWDYNHGTGHGIGFFLNVHEGPGRIAIGYNPDNSALHAGMFFSDEPGYYEDGSFGVRLENICGIEVKNTSHRFNGKDYLGFKAATLVPYEPKLIKTERLSADQRAWLNEYNERCREETGQYLLDLEKRQAYEWLLTKTEPISDSSGISQAVETKLSTYCVFVILFRCSLQVLSV